MRYIQKPVMGLFGGASVSGISPEEATATIDKCRSEIMKSLQRDISEAPQTVPDLPMPVNAWLNTQKDEVIVLLEAEDGEAAQTIVAPVRPLGEFAKADYFLVLCNEKKLWQLWEQAETRMRSFGFTVMQDRGRDRLAMSRGPRRNG